LEGAFVAKRYQHLWRYQQGKQFDWKILQIFVHLPIHPEQYLEEKFTPFMVDVDLDKCWKPPKSKRKKNGESNNCQNDLDNQVNQPENVCFEKLIFIPKLVRYLC